MTIEELAEMIKKQGELIQQQSEEIKLLKSEKGKEEEKNEDKQNSGVDSGGYKDHLTEEQKRKQEKEKLKNLESVIKFNGSFPELLKKYEKLFPERTKSLIDRPFESEQEKAELIKKYAAKDFFSIKENLDLVPSDQKEFVKSSIVDDFEVRIEADKAWSFVESAIHANNLREDAGKRYALGGELSNDADIEKISEQFLGAK